MSAALPPWNIAMARSMFHAKDRADAWDVIADLMDSGLDDNRAIAAAAHMFRLRGKRAAAMVLEDLERSFARGAFAETVKLVAKGSEALLFANVGKVTGSVVYRGAARVLRNEKLIRNAVVEALSKPVALLLAVIGLVVAMGLRLFPAFEALTPRNQWPALTRFMASVSEWVISSGWIGVIGFVLLCVLTALSLPLLASANSRSIRRFREFLDRYPPWSFYRLSTGASFAFTIVEVARSGGTISGPTLADMTEHGSRYTSTNVARMAEALNSGQSLEEAFQGGGSFPDPELNAVMGVLAGQPNALENFGVYTDRWMLAAEKRVKAKAAIINMVLITLIAAVIISVVTAIFSVISSVQSGL